MVLVVVDRSQTLMQEIKDILSSLAGKRAAIVLNKTDLPAAVTTEQLMEYSLPIIAISAATGEGMDELEHFLTEAAAQNSFTGNEVLLANARHTELVRQSLAALERASESVRAGMPADFAIVDIREAWELLGAITGDTAQSDIVGEIFSRFCLGK